MSSTEIPGSTAPEEAPDDELRPLLARLGRETGFAALGIAPVSYPQARENLKAWIDAGHHAGMNWLAETAELRLDLRRRFSWARSLIVAVKSYHPRALPLGEEAGIAAGVSVYARGLDYHDVLLPALKSLGNRLEGELAPRPLRRHVYVDTGPVLERQAAAAAGLGWLGKNGLLLRPREGSWTFLGVMVTDLDLSPGPVAGAPSRGSCGICRACQPACPTGALVAPGVLDSRRCISYLTIEHRGAIDRSLRRAMGGWIFGCDLCQSACPVNHRASLRSLRIGREKHLSAGSLDGAEISASVSSSGDGPAATISLKGQNDFTSPSSVLTGITLPQLLALDEDEFRRRFKNTPLWRPRREGLLRNALIAAANLHRLDCVDAACALLADSSGVLREAASWCLAELKPSPGTLDGLNSSFNAFDELRAAVERERDPELKRIMAQDLIRAVAASPRSR